MQLPKLAAVPELIKCQLLLDYQFVKLLQLIQLLLLFVKLFQLLLRELQVPKNAHYAQANSTNALLQMQSLIKLPDVGLE